MNIHWYVIQVRRGKEEEIAKKCRANISKEILEECFIPKSQQVRKFKGKWCQQNVILFSGYVFMISSHVKELFQELKKIPDITKLLGNDGNEIYPIYEDEVLFLMQFGKNEHIVEMSKGYIEGDRIFIESGPLLGKEGIIRKINRHKRIAEVEVSLFEQKTRVKVGLEVVSKK